MSSNKHGSSDWRTIKRLLREASSSRLLLLGLFGLGLLSTPIALMQPLALKVIVDSVIGDTALPSFFDGLFAKTDGRYGTSLLWAAVTLQILVVLLVQLQAVAKSLMQTFVGERISLRFRAKLLNHAQRLSFAFHDRRGTHDSIYRIQYDATAVQHVAVYSVVTVLTAFLDIVLMLCVMFSLHAKLTLVALPVLPLMFLLSRFYAKRMKPRYKRAKSLESSALGVVQEVLTSFRVVKAFGREAHEEQRFVDQSRKGVRARIRLGVAEGAFGLLVGLTTAAGTAAVIYVGALAVRADEIEIGTLLMMLTYLNHLYGPVRTMGKNVAGLQKQIASAERSFELLDESPDVVEKDDALPLDRAFGHVSFDGVSFSYEEGQPILEGVGFRVPAGSRVGIVGRTGAGKTTLVSLMTRFYDPAHGKISIDGVDLRDYKLDDLRRQFSIVLQDPVLFSSSIASNIAYARPEASQEDIERAARAAGAHEFIAAMPEGYDTVVGERGMRLSGGERQRISLARAFLKDAPILVLDEPTSSVDVKTEAEIMATMQELMKGRTTFMIAHRLSTLTTCDRVLRIADGGLEIESAPQIEASEAG